MVGALIFLLVLVIVLIGAGIAIYNGLVSLREQSSNAWSQIDVQLKRRYDLIPNLVETVKGFMTHEQETLTKVIEARNAAQSAQGVKEQAAAENQLTRAIGGIFALSEGYPELKSASVMQQLQEELRSTENKISLARQYYNDVVTQYNTRQRVFPASIIANAGGFKPRDLFEIELAEERNPVKVSF